MVVDVKNLPGNVPSSAYILSFLVHHDWDDIAPTLTDSQKKDLILDVTGSITLTAATRTFTLQLGNLSTSATWTPKNNPTFIDLNNQSGSLFLAPNADPPSGVNTFWIQQYPASSGNPVGRTVIEFYTDNVITAVFKTYVDNFGGWGTVNWSST